MLVPSTRLLWLVALVVIPALTLAGVSPAALSVCVLIVACVALLVLADLVFAGSVFQGISAAWPGTARLTQDRAGAIDLQLNNATPRARRLRVGLDFPPEFRVEDYELSLTLPAGNAPVRLQWPVTATRRGKFALEYAYLELPSPLGLWAVRRRKALNGEVRVYPNLMGERRTMAAIFLHRGGVGLHAQRQVGKGRDFEKLREYVPGDSYDEISWKATAKRGRPITRVFQVERTQEVYVVVDASRLSARAPLGEGVEAGPDGMPSLTILDRAITAALALGLAAERQGDLFGLITFADQVRGFLPAKTGKEHFNSAREALYTLRPQLVAPDFYELFTFIRLRLRKRALIVFLTSLDDPALAESFAKNVQILKKQHLVLVNMITPPGARPLFSGPEPERIEQVYDELGGHMRWQELRRLEKVLAREGIAFRMLENEKLCPELVSQYLNVKQRQAI